MPFKPRELTLVNITNDFLQFLSFWNLNPLWYKGYNQTILWLHKNINKILLTAVKWSQVRHSGLIQEPPSQFFISFSFAPLNAQFLSIIRKKIILSSTSCRKNRPKLFLILKMMPIPFLKLCTTQWYMIRNYEANFPKVFLHLHPQKEYL